MDLIDVAESMGVTERGFTLDVEGARVPGLLWTPTGASGPLPLVLMGHGGSQHKRTETLLARARRFVRRLGFAVAAIDAPGHGDRATPEERERRVEALRGRIEGRHRPDPAVVREIVARSAQAVPEWKATLDALLPVVEGGPVGYWGVSMGTAIGVPFVADEPRVVAAVFGLNGALTGDGLLTDAARRITIPVEFTVQSDDELVDREAAIALFDAFASTEKTLHLNPGGHLEVPAFEAESWQAFFDRHLKGLAS
jgi:pimeloyl-ACP methyl ester carboxylesterase